MDISKDYFGELNRGEKVSLYTLKNETCCIKISNYGGIITTIEIPDKNGKLDNVALGFKSLSEYTNDFYKDNMPFFGCIVGRYGNRIANGKFNLEGKEYTLEKNNEDNHLHGGTFGFHTKIWDAKTEERDNEVELELSYLSKDMEEGYPGNLNVIVKYVLTSKNELLIKYFAKTDKPTVLNLTNHTYFNLKGNRGNILDHQLILNAEKYTESIDLIPTSKLVLVNNTPFDFRELKEIGKDIQQLNDGYDLNYVLNKPNDDFSKAAELIEPESGRKVSIYTTQPGIQLYTGYYIPEFDINGRKIYGKYAGLALETQHFPDSPNHSVFPPTVLLPNEEYKHMTVYKFEIIS